MNNTSQFTTIIKPPSRVISLDLKEVWAHRELLWLFVSRNIKIRYKQTLIGASWAIFQPLAIMLIFTVFFGLLIKVPSDGAPYAIFVYTGLVYWNYFNTAMPLASNSMIENESIVKKVYFPRLIVPIATTITPAIDFLLSFLILFSLMLYYHFTPGLLGIVMIPVLLFIGFIASTGIGLIMASFNVRFHDVRYILPFFVMLLFYITPIIYSINIVPIKYHWIILMNPMAGVIIFARTSLLGTGTNDWGALAISAGLSILLLVIGLFTFKKAESEFADLI